MLPAIQMSDALLSAYSSGFNPPQPVTWKDEWFEVLRSAEDIARKIRALDQILSNHNIPEDIGEMLFDLLLFQFFSEDQMRLDESYFESPAWEKVEQIMMDRGTELLNILLYLQECKDNEIHPSLDDYLDEYLAMDIDFDSGEMEIYEPILKNREILAQGNLDVCLRIAGQNPDALLGDQLLPVLVFFEEESAPQQKYNFLKAHGTNPVFQTAFLSVLNELNKIK